MILPHGKQFGPMISSNSWRKISKALFQKNYLGSCQNETHRSLKNKILGIAG